ncbi:MAG TPA: cupin domain-containing protein [Steroidobacteraceae bacterium]|jgi:quercetin dioxygenase-like cupin family protein|nr:cupin domain-containing protein [Steroidobacteraceae bacterium]
MNMWRALAANVALALVLALTTSANADEKASRTVVQELRTEAIAEYPGHELNMITVEYPPGGGSKPHRHNAYVLVYVLEGTLEMKVRGTPVVTVHAGESFVERPDDIHEISRNASQTEKAKFLAVALKTTGQPLSTTAASR